MTEGASAPAALAPGPRLPALRKEFLVVAVASAAAMLCLGVEVWNEVERAKAPLRSQPPAMVAFLGAIVIAFGDASWISTDRKRRGKAVGLWRFAALFLGPVAICLHFILESRDRAIFLLPAAVAVCGATLTFPGVAVCLLRRAWL